MGTTTSWTLALRSLGLAVALLNSACTSLPADTAAPQDGSPEAVTPSPTSQDDSSGAGASPADGSAPADGADRTFRVMAANISSGTLQSYPNPGPGARIFQALQPDLVLIQEFNVNATRNQPNDDAAVDQWVDEVFGADYHWFREPGGDSIPNGVISRWPIVESGEWRDPEVNNRDFAFARIDIPGDRDLWAVSVHLLTRNSTVRNDEARALVRAIQEHPVPEDDYLVIGGDFNTNVRNEPALTSLQQVVDVLGPFPDDGAMPSSDGTNRSRRKPYDWVLVEADLQAEAMATVVGDFRFPNGLVFDSRVFDQDQLDESFPPVREADSDATNMQHMAVVRDFRVPVGTPGAGQDFTITSDRIDFGTVASTAGPFVDSSVTLRVARPFDLTAISFSGTHADEMQLTDPDLSAGPVTIDVDRSLTFSWTPMRDEGAERQVTATLVTAGDPGAVEIELVGRVRAAGGQAPLDIGGFRLEQTGGAASLVFPAGTVIEPGALVVIGRAASRAEFEAFWGLLGPNAIFFDGSELAGDTGFPIINGGERYRLLDAQGVSVDPADGQQLPLGATARGRAYQREATDGTSFVVRDDPRNQANPGRFAGNTAGTNQLVITEISDATGGGSFVFEFLELFYDAAGSP